MKRAVPTLSMILAPAFVAALAVLASLFYTDDPDVYWHMATARAALATHSFLPKDPFSYSMAGAPWHHKDLLAEAVLYLGFTALGYPWFAALKALGAVATATFVHRSVPRESRGPLVLVAVAGLLVQSFLFIEQPALFSIVLFAATLAIAQSATAIADADAKAGVGVGVGVGAGVSEGVGVGVSMDLLRRLAVWVGVNFIWTWLHRFSLLGQAMLMVWAALLVAARRAPDRPAIRVLFGPRPSSSAARLAVLAAIVSPLVAFANPSGVHALWSGSTMAAHPELREQFWEWKRTGLTELWDAFPVALALTAAAAVLAVGRVVAALVRREEACPVRAWHAVLFVGLALMTRDSVRWMPYLAMVSVAILARLFGEALGAVPAPRRALLLPFFGVAMVAWYAFARRVVPYAVGEDPSWAPRGAVAFARAHGLAGPVVNAFDLGGYLIWADPDAKVLVDGRNELVYPPEFVVTCLRAEHDRATFESMRGDDHATWAIGINTPGQPGFAFLEQDPRWMMVYWSEPAAIYVRLDAHRELEATGYRFIDGRNPMLSVMAAMQRMGAIPAAVAAIGAEVKAMLAASPDGVRALMTAALYDEALGPPGRAERDRTIARLQRVAGGRPEVDDFVRAIGGMGLEGAGETRAPP